MEFVKIDLQKKLSLALVFGDQAQVMDAQPIGVEWEDNFILNIKFSVPGIIRKKEIKPLPGIDQHQKDLSTVGELLGRILETHERALAEYSAMRDAKQLLEE